ncbi:MAG: glycosyltransferase [Methylococcaceae bacterium]|jgi:glycosyltransferase involved in cell wall biosynthesis
MDSKTTNTLGQLYAEHTGKVSDKWSLYLTEYERLFNGFREKPISLLEIGIQNGGSLEIWGKYFSKAENLVGCDINPDCSKLEYEDPRVKVIVGDANALDIYAKVVECSPSYDIIIDDGSHFSSDIVKTFALYFPKLKEGGVFVAEDLHCSYWGSYEGGLFYPYSSLSFFKKLADIINYEHWGVAKSQNEILKGVFEKYECEIDNAVLAQLHSIEFINSICIVRKAPTNENILGSRLISGNFELIVPNLIKLNDSPYKLGVSADQSGNHWSTRLMPPEESIERTELELLGIRKQLAEVDQQFFEINQKVKERDDAISGLRQVLEAKEDQIAQCKQEILELRNSTSWRVMAPLRFAITRAKILARRLQQKNNSSVDKKKIKAIANIKSREWLIQKGHRVYREHFKATKIGRLMAQKILKYGLVSVAELQISALSHHPLPSEHQSVSNSTELTAETGVPGFHLSLPLNFETSDRLFLRPHINVLLPSLRLKHMSGGPNTALLLAALLAEKGEQIRIIACDASAEGEESALFPHMDGLLQRKVARGRITLVDAFDRSEATLVGVNDVFLATAWWTAQIANYALAKMLKKTFIYLIQDFEPILHEGSTFQARALETYGLPHIPVINTRLLLDHLVQERAGCYADPLFANNALWFEPALDRRYYFPEVSASSSGKKTLLFYARPTSARRNLFEMGVVALRKAVASGVIDNNTWEIWGMGENFAPVALGQEMYLKPLPWLAFDDYAKQVRNADLLLSLMLSPHPSYPPLEMAASGKLVVTNSFSVKTAERMALFSANIIVAKPNADSVAAALVNAAGRINAGLQSHDMTGNMALPVNWDDSLDEVASELIARLKALRASPDNIQQFALGYPTIPKTDYEDYRRICLQKRRHAGEYHQEAGLLSFVTSAYNTPPEYLEELAVSVFLQDGGTQFEWFILDNGSTDQDTRQTLQALAGFPNVCFARVEENLGIIGGMRFCLEQASGRYIMPLDSDDLIEPDCVNVLTRYIKDNNYPALLYTDEDKLAEGHFGSPYFKPDWDPVLFLHSCYIAHLCVIDRLLALELKLYSDKAAEGCHDWDSFIRFMNAGYTPYHVPEVLYSWRIHGGSTSGNIASKSYITESHRAVLQHCLDYRKTENLELKFSPLFNYNVDWWFRRKQEKPVSLASVAIKGKVQAELPNGLKVIASLTAGREESIANFADAIFLAETEFVHLCWNGVFPDDSEWSWEAAGLFELFPDAVMVGGTLHDARQVLDGPRMFGCGGGFDCPDRGRPLVDPGYSATMWKSRSVSALSSGHCVVRRDFLMQMLPTLVAEHICLELLGPWLGGLAARNAKRIVFSPFMRAKASIIPEDTAPSSEVSKFLSHFWELMPDTRFYSKHFGLTLDTAYLPIFVGNRELHLKTLQSQGLLSYGEWLEQALHSRKAKYLLAESTDYPKISILTPVYEGSDLGLLNELAMAINKQSLAALEWWLIINGPMPESKMAFINARVGNEWQARLIIETQPVGIIRALRMGLEAASGEYIIPVDADDLITFDAIQIITHEIIRSECPDFLYSDEDLLVNGKPALPCLRGTFDKVLALENSTIWHLCAMKKATALAADVYGDSAANWCQDWDSVSRIESFGGRIQHVPEVLYHWRQHSGSTTNNNIGDPRSLESVRFILQRHIAQSSNPQHFSIEDWPNSRGARELYIARKAIPLPNFLWFEEVFNEGGQVDNDAILVFIGKGVSITSQAVYEEVARLFELHANLAAVGGLLERADGIVVDGCYCINTRGELASPWLGQLSTEGGAFALALKPQSVAMTGHALAFFRVSALKDAGLWPQRLHSEEAGTAWQLCNRLIDKNWGIAFSPLVRAKAGVLFQTKTADSLVLPASTQKISHAYARYGLALNYRIG